MSDIPVLERVLFSQEQLTKRAEELGRQISADYRGKQPLFVGILRGCILFYADLMKNISVDCNMDFMCLSSYAGGTATTGQVRTMLDLRESIKGRHVVIVEDIVDSGYTMQRLIAQLQDLGARTVKVAVLLNKPNARKVEGLNIDYCCLEIPNDFIVGYGLDYNEEGRNLPDIYVVTE